MKNPKTYRLDRLYFQFLKPNNLDSNLIDRLAAIMAEHGFIFVYPADHQKFGRYCETEKLNKKEAKQELYSILTSL